MRFGRWEDAMIAQTRLLEWTESDLGMRYLAGFFQDMNEKHTEQARRDPRLLMGIQHEMLRLGEPIYVSADVCDLIDNARKTWQPERLLPGDAFAPRGFLLLPRPILIDDMPPTKENPLRATPAPGALHGYIPVRAIAWLPLHSEDLSVGAFWIAFYLHVDDEYELADELGAPSRFDLPGPDGGRISREEARKVMPMSVVHQWQWSWGSTDPWADENSRAWDDPSRFDVLPEDSLEQLIERSRMQTALMQTIWRIGSQLVPTRERPQRQWWRDANRKGIPHREVTVITLRRGREPKEHDGEGRKITVRFVVRGHWRRQWYPSLQDHRQIWVAPYLKGEDHMPLRLTDRAWHFTR